MLMDYHVHTSASPDAEGEIEDYLGRAAEAGIGEIGFSDHIMLRELSGYPHVPQEQIPLYMRRLQEAKRSSEVTVKIGVEIDFFKEDTIAIKRFIERYPFDYVIGAVHFLGEWCFDDPRFKHEYHRRNLLEVYRCYFNEFAAMCRTGLFDVAAHFDLIKIFGFKPEADYSDAVAEAIEAIAKSKMCIEINTSGLRKPCGEIYPSEQLLALLYEFDVPIVFSSDAHSPRDLAANFKEAVQLAKKIGYTQACLFNQRRRTFTEI